ncbi:MAG TPA: FtsK/SpoIIIE domain-containing protein, partial [Planctomycetia bacterium]|nr:FtsK/SpoIIIE domain-containing protein [Planctomycetia bacterium]
MSATLQTPSAPSGGQPPAGPEIEADDLPARQRALLRDLSRLIDERHQLEGDSDPRYGGRKTQILKEYTDKERIAKTTFDGAKAKTEKEYAQRRTESESAGQAEISRAKIALSEATEAAESAHGAATQRAKKKLKDARWEAQAIAESTERGAKERFLELRAASSKLAGRVGDLWTETYRELQKSERQQLLPRLDEAPSPDGEPEAAAAIPAIESAEAAAEGAAGEPETAGPVEPPAFDPAADAEQVEKRLAAASEWLGKLQRLRVARWARADFVAYPFIALGLAAMWPASQALGAAWGIGGSALAAIGIGVAFGIFFVRYGTKVTRKVIAKIMGELQGAERLRAESFERSRIVYRREVWKIRRQLGTELKLADREYERRKNEAEGLREARRAEAEGTFPAKIAGLESGLVAKLAELDRVYPERLAKLKQDHDAELAGLAADRDRKLAKLADDQKTEWETLTAKWRAMMKRAKEESEDFRALCNEMFPEWTEGTIDAWRPAERFPRCLAFGELGASLEHLPNGTPRDARLVGAEGFAEAWPALVPFPGGSLLLKAPGTALAAANDCLQATMLRALAALPPGKSRFTIIDPVGLGQNFAAFMHLADFDEALVHHRIWTEPSQIEQCLADLTEHMETVIQKYLRNEFDSIEAYNEEAGEVAEPYRFVVVANFPANFTEGAARRLASIIHSGARCGVQTVMTIDPRQPMPHGISLADLETRCTSIAWQTAKDAPPKWVFKDRDFERFPLTLAKPPNAETVTGLMQKIGTLAKDANRVQVPFDMVAPPPEKWWTEDSAKGVSVPLGRSGATKLQSLRLGQGTSQHVLIAGRTGSGKSTLLHALVTNLALHYSPEEVELYLIDFKKGVEFKTYATHALPHARVIAIESEREFGLSAMQKLDHELRRRGDLFRDLGVQDLAGYRQLRKEQPQREPMPRLLLIVDEFQEFFVEDDRIAQEASLLLDRLVRQGRAFGIHVHLGSQTLGGAYSLARSTLGQMAVRIALQCSEADAHLILSEDNSAARLLGRPGEAIYNDSNGAVEGNSPFQVVWLPDERREAYLKSIHELAVKRGMLPTTPAIVFEGNAPADVRTNE